MKIIHSHILLYVVCTAIGYFLGKVYCDVNQGISAGILLAAALSLYATV